MINAAHRQNRLAGDVVLRSPASVTLATAAICGLLLAVFLFAALVTYPREATLSGWLEPAPDGGVRAVLAVPAADAAWLQPGQAVALTLPAFADTGQDALTGIVEPFVAPAPGGPPFRVTLRLDRQTMRAGGAETPLPPAAALSARVTLGRASLLSLVTGSAFRRPNG